MQLARVVGDVVSTVKNEALGGHKLLVLQPITPAKEPIGRTLVALDAVGAGVGEHVFFVRGKEAAFPFYPAEPPTDACIVGIVDRWDLEEARSRRSSETRSPGSSETRSPGTSDPGKPRT